MAIDVTALGASTGAQTATSSTAGQSTLDPQAFLSLLITQLTHQDPSSPMDSTQIMTQTTQLASMQALTTLTDYSREEFALQMRTAGAALLGQTVTWTDADGASQQGTVTGVSYAGSTPLVQVGDQQVALDAVASVTAA
jgi:flagellar basal-body rod modification protein FlgD